MASMEQSVASADSDATRCCRPPFATQNQRSAAVLRSVSFATQLTAAGHRVAVYASFFKIGQGLRHKWATLQLAKVAAMASAKHTEELLIL